VKAARVRSTGMAPLASCLAHVAPAQVIWPRRSHARSRGAGSPLRDTCVFGCAGNATADVLRGTDATEDATDVKAKRCCDRWVAHGLLAGRHVSTRAHGCIRATRTRSSMHSIRPAAQPSCWRCSGTPDTDMRGEEISERRAIVNARRERCGLDHRVLASEARVAVDARDRGVAAKSKWSAVESTRGLQSAR
jgi:hypothetical protein